MQSEAPQKGWFARNWMWLVPVGCLAPIVGLVVFVAAIFMVVSGAMRSSDAYQEAMSRVRENPEIVEALGEPIEVGLFFTGNISVNGPEGEANMSIPVNGPSGSGTLHVVAEKKAGQWIFETIEVQLEDSGQRVNLMGESPEAEQPR